MINDVVALVCAALATLLGTSSLCWLCTAPQQLAHACRYEQGTRALGITRMTHCIYVTRAPLASPGLLF
jgi:hypothetical protein